MSARRLPRATAPAASDLREESPLLDAFYQAAADMVATNPVAIQLTYEDAKGALYCVTIPDLTCVFEGMRARLLKEKLAR